MMKHVVTTGLLTALLVLGGCATSRYDELRGRSRQVERSLRAERDAALLMPAGSAEGRAKIDHLSTMRASLTAVDIGLAAVRRFVPESERPLAYDAIEEAYDTIEWNIPLLPGQETRPLPGAFRGGVFDVGRFTAPAD